MTAEPQVSELPGGFSALGGVPLEGGVVMSLGETAWLRPRYINYRVHVIAAVHLLSHSSVVVCLNRADALIVLSACCWRRIFITRTRKGGAPCVRRKWLRGNTDRAVALSGWREIKKVR